MKDTVAWCGLNEERYTCKTSIMTWNLLQLSTIWAETADNARSAARSFILGGLSEKYYGLSDFWVADHINVC